MTPVITLRAPVVLPPAMPEPDDPDPELAFQSARFAGWNDEVAAAWAAHTAGLAVVDPDGDTLAWTIRSVRHLRFLRRLVADGRLGGDTEVDR